MNEEQPPLTLFIKMVNVLQKYGELISAEKAVGSTMNVIVM